MKSFNADSYYFRITFYDRAMAFPAVEVFRYMGNNLSNDDAEDTAYFEFMESYAEGISSGDDRQEPARVTLVTDRDAVEMLDLSELAAELTAAQSRYMKAASRTSTK